MLGSLVKSTLKIAFGFLFLSLILLVLTIAFLPKFVSPDTINSTLKTLVEDNSELILDIEGDSSFAILPEFIIKIKKITVEGTKQTFIEDVNLQIDLMDILTNSLGLSASLSVDKKPIDVKINLGDFTALIAGKATKLDIELSKPRSIFLSSVITNQENAGSIKINSLKLENTKGSGNIEWKNEAGGKPSYRGELSFDLLDIDEIKQYISALEDASVVKNAAAPKKPTEDKGKHVWSEEPLDFKWVEATNVDFLVTAKKIRVSGSDYGKTSLKIDIADSKFKAELLESNLFGGEGTGKVVVNNSGDIPSVSKNFEFKNIEVGDLLSQTTDFSRFQGKGNLSINILTSGNTEKEMVGNLGGKGSVSVTDGTLKNVDIVAMSSSNKKKIREAFNANKDTEITSLFGSIKINNGIISNDDLEIKMPFTKLKGNGDINLVDWKIDYIVTPSLEVAKIGLSVPIKFLGDLNSPLIIPDLVGLVTKNIDQIGVLDTKAIKGMKKDFKSFKKDVGKALIGGLLGDKKKDNNNGVTP